MLNWLLASRFWSLVRKEINQILHNKQLVILLIFPPTVQLLIYGFVLNPDVHYLKMGVVDYARSQQSRELISSFTENRIFILDQVLSSEQELGEQVEQGKLTVGMVIPPEFDRNLAKDQTTEIQILIDGLMRTQRESLMAMQVKSCANIA
jgi:ABC-2 type transport system permease protein